MLSVSLTESSFLAPYLCWRHMRAQVRRSVPGATRAHLSCPSLLQVDQCTPLVVPAPAAPPLLDVPTFATSAPPPTMQQSFWLPTASVQQVPR